MVRETCGLAYACIRVAQARSSRAQGNALAYLLRKSSDGKAQLVNRFVALGRSIFCCFELGRQHSIQGQRRGELLLALL